ncbi:non-ribosomal peptide synthetase [Chitinophaga filiformis]|uniref:Amino acid adenylation domain-containing protein n=1 Tax=Chitinophaga filiformis TaxID=104663 RepID=A0A1G8B863_CHIFI|nr:non-ribosomal peptide synthetase [Chitinophaga filiformis]SDH29193.1 amino acid adenylation domain-containing protein [Chitinophaga filiformis]
MDLQQQSALDYWFRQCKNNSDGPFFLTGSRSSIACNLSSATLAKLEQAGNRQDMSTLVIVLAAWLVLLKRYGLDQQVVFMPPVVGGPVPVPAEKGQQLYFRFDIHKDTVFREMVNGLSLAFKTALQHQDYNAGKLDELFEANGLPVRTAHYQVGIAHDSLHDIPSCTERAALALVILKDQPWQLYYQEGILPGHLLDQLPLHLDRILSSLLHEPGKPVLQSAMLSDEELAHLYALSGEAQQIPVKGQLLHELFEQTVEERPHGIVLVDKEDKITYKELAEEANRLAGYLSGVAGVRPGDVVALLMTHDKWAIISILGILKAGATYLPIDTAYPAERIAYMIHDAKAVLTISNVPVSIPGIPVLEMEWWEGERNLYPSNTTLPVVTADTAAYIIYTSGSTGHPKGVAITHVQVCQLLASLQHEMGFGTGLHYILNASLSFDAAVKEIFLPLAYKGTLHLPPDYRNIPQLADYLQQHHINVLHASPLYWEALLPLLPSVPLQYISCGGDVLSSRLAADIRKQLPEAVFMNLYGPTETCINATGYRINHVTTSVPIGSALPGYSVFVVDREGSLLPLGMAGELCIAGQGIAAGYINNKAATEQAFVSLEINGVRRLYRTGDKVKWNEQGELEFLGRMDQQVKIRGYRIEPEEVRLAILKDNRVAEAYVTADNGADGVPVLVAYLRMTTAESPEVVKTFVSAQLPAYMLPSKWVVVKHFPRNTAGKIDKTKLPDPEDIQQYIAPVKATEKALAVMWKDVLKIDHAGLHDHFFDRGGHSLSAIRLLSVIIQQLQVKLELNDIFTFPVLKDMAARIDQQTGVPVLSIPIAPSAAYYPVSPAQQRLWIIDRLEEGKAPYNIPLAFQINGKLDEAALFKALDIISRQYDILRTSFIEIDGAPYMQVQDASTFQPAVEKVWYSAHPEELCAAAAARPFVLEQSPLWRLLLIYVEGGVVGMLTFHHIIADGWSMHVFTDTLLSLYKDIATGKSPLHQPLSLQYKDYAVWMRENMQSEKMLAAQRYWEGEFEKGVTPVALPADNTRPLVKAYQGHAIYTSFPADLADKLQRFSQQQEVTPFVILLAAFRLLLYRYTAQPDIVIGVPVSGREQGALDQQIGFFVNILPVLLHITEEDNFHTLIQREKAHLLESYRHQDYPFDKLVEILKIERDSSRSPLFDVMFGSWPGNELMDKALLPDQQLSSFEMPVTTSKYDLLLNVETVEGNYRIYTEYDTALFSEMRIRQMMDHYLLLLDAALDHAADTITSLDYITTAEYNTLLNDFQSQRLVYPYHPSLYHLFMHQVALVPGRKAVIADEGTLDYATLSGKVNQLAAALIAHGITPGQPVGIIMKRSSVLLISILAIHKAGAFYVPLSPSLPIHRISYILQDAAVKVVLTDADLVTVVENEADVLIPELLLAATYEGEEVPAQTGSLAYMIYTSGSTGEPKGVAITHQQVMNTLWALQELYPSGEEDTWLLKTNYTFDVSVSELFGWIPGGSKVAILREGEEKELHLLLEAIRRKKITHISFVPSLFTLFFDTLKTDKEAFRLLRYILIAGEAFPEKLVMAIHAGGWAEKVFNLYGPTEASIYTTAFALEDYQEGKPVYIGKPLPNVKVYILDANDRLVASGVYGELCIGGPGVSNGYWNNPALTAARFTRDPFGEGILYRSGDLARWSNDGNIEYLGRKDEQVKINGYRVETGEIEHVLEKAPGIRQAIVVKKTDHAGNARLIAYVTTDGVADTTSLSVFAGQWLPSYMIPVMYVVLDVMPVSSSGKIDRKALPDPDFSVGSEEGSYTPPEAPSQEQLARLWSQLLSVDKPGIHDNFFRLGGNSLLAIKLSAAIRKEYNVVLAVKDIFRFPTIAQLDTFMGTLKKDSTQLVAAAAHGPLPLSFSQERFWLLDKWGQGATYHIPVVLRLKGDLNIAALENALSVVIQRHSALRTLVREKNGIPFQHIVDAASWKLTITEDIRFSDSAYLDTYIHAFVYNAFDLSVDLPVRGSLLKINPQEHLFLLTFHHIAIDIWSVYLMGDEIGRLYKDGAAQLELLPVQYADYALWQRRQMETGELAQRLQHWKEELKDIGPLEMPADHIRPAVNEYNGNTYRAVINPEITTRIRQLAAGYNTTLFVALLSVFKVLLHRYTGKQDIAVGVPVANRDLEDVSSLVGCFINTIVLRSQVKPDMPFEQLLQELSRHAAIAYAHQDVPFEMVLEQLGGSGDRNALFEVMFDLQDMPASTPLELDGIAIEEVKFQRTKAFFDLNFALSTDRINGTIILDVEYNTALFEAARIEQLVNHYITLLQSVIQDQQCLVGNMQLLTVADHVMLTTFSGEKVVFPQTNSILDMIREQGVQHPDRMAVLFNDRGISFRQLEEQSNQLAHYLQEQGIQKEATVAIWLNRSVEVVVAMLGILKAGASYLPIDPAYPPERVAYMLEDAAATMMITDSPDVVKENILVIPVDQLPVIMSRYSPDPVATDIHPQQLAYTIYTSGSTGQPKGVMIAHRNLVNITYGWRWKFDLDKQRTVVLSLASIAFDVFTGDLCRALPNGGTLVIADTRNLDWGELYSVMQKHQVTYIESTPAVITNLFSHIDKHSLDISFLRVMVSCADALPAEKYIYLRKRFLSSRLRVLNSYGITETTIDCSGYEQDTPIIGITPIGRSLPNIFYYILDEQQQQVPVNVWGELYVGGDGVGIGYRNKPVLTAERFINIMIGGEMKRVYKSGDIARWTPDGNVVFGGRRDDQVKVRGFRIELSEIVNNLLQYPSVKSAVAVVHATPGNTAEKYICAYYVADDNTVESPTVSALRNFLQDKLPHYMVPQYFIRLDAIPVTSNKKVDKKRLPLPETAGLQSGQEIVLPANEVESTLYTLWTDVLKGVPFGVTDNFFEIGGNSLKAVQLLALINEQCFTDIKMRTFIASPVIRELSQHVIRFYEEQKELFEEALEDGAGDQA